MPDIDVISYLKHLSENPDEIEIETDEVDEVLKKIVHLVRRSKHTEQSKQALSARVFDVLDKSFNQMMADQNED